MFKFFLPPHFVARRDLAENHTKFGKRMFIRIYESFFIFNFRFNSKWRFTQISKRIGGKANTSELLFMVSHRRMGEKINVSKFLLSKQI